MTNEEIIREMLAMHERPRSLDLKVEVPCPMKQRFRNEYLAFEQALVANGAAKPYTFAPTICPAHVETDNTLRDFAAMDSLEKVPDLIVDMVFGDLIMSGFMDRFVRAGAFKRVMPEAPLSLMDPVQFADRYEAFNPLALFPEVMLIDRKALGDRPIPTRMEDLLDPVYEGMFGLPDQHTEIGAKFLMYIFQHYGEDGLAAIERNTISGFLGPDGARCAGTNAEPRAGIYLTPWIFAQGACTPGRVEIVWPQDGVFVQPIALLVKKDMRPENEPLLEWLLSEQVGRIFADNQFISTNPNVDNHLPTSLESVQWLGWDWIYDTNLLALKDVLVERFNRFHRPGMC